MDMVKTLGWVDPGPRYYDTTRATRLGTCCVHTDDRHDGPDGVCRSNVWVGPALDDFEPCLCQGFEPRRA